jgi:hypothetical protein
MRRRGIADELRTGRNIGLIAIASRDARATLDQDAESIPYERLNDRRHQGNAMLVGSSLNWYSNCDVRHFDSASSAFVRLV